MAEKYIAEDEYFPFYSIEDPHSPAVAKYVREIPQDKLQWIVRVMTEFEEVQTYLGELRGN